MPQQEIKRVEEERKAENVMVFISPAPSSVLLAVVSFLVATAPVKRVLFHNCGLCWSVMIVLPPLDPVGLSLLLVLVFQSCWFVVSHHIFFVLLTCLHFCKIFIKFFPQ